MATTTLTLHSTALPPSGNEQQPPQQQQQQPPSSPLGSSSALYRRSLWATVGLTRPQAQAPPAAREAYFAPELFAPPANFKRLPAGAAPPSAFDGVGVPAAKRARLCGAAATVPAGDCAQHMRAAGAAARTRSGGGGSGGVVWGATADCFDDGAGWGVGWGQQSGGGGGHNGDDGDDGGWHPLLLHVPRRPRGFSQQRRPRAAAALAGVVSKYLGCGGSSGLQQQPWDAGGGGGSLGSGSSGGGSAYGGSGAFTRGGSAALAADLLAVALPRPGAAAAVAAAAGAGVLKARCALAAAFPG